MRNNKRLKYSDTFISITSNRFNNGFSQFGSAVQPAMANIYTNKQKYTYIRAKRIII